MDSLNVLVIAYYFPPMALSGVQRISKFVKYLPEYGWNPIVLTTSAPYYQYDYSLLDELIEKNIKIYRTDENLSKSTKKINKTNLETKEDNENFGENQKNINNSDHFTLSYPGRLRQRLQAIILQTIFQPDSRRMWKKKALKTAEKIFEENEIDLILATAPPFTDFLVAEELSDKYNIPFILDYRDLWVDNPYYFYSTIFHKNYAVKLENRILTKAARTIVITREMKNAILQRYRFLNHNDITIIPHGYDQEDIEKAKSHQQHTPEIFPLNNNIKHSKFIITHSGLFSQDLTPKYLFQAVSELIQEKPEMKDTLEIRMVGIMQKKFLKMINKLNLQENIKTLGYLNHIQSVQALVQSYVLWLMMPNGLVTPGRLFEYLGARKPIIFSSPKSELTQIVESTGAGIITSPNDMKELKKAILNYYNLWKKNSLPIPNESVVEKYERKELTRQLAKELAYCVKLFR
ncbi:MAG TPA: glycosyltransferase [Candidatus Kapabacteria bacterium]|nr:glycosyltransferase [Candidatus Kapabacteria bacterium]